MLRFLVLFLIVSSVVSAKVQRTQILSCNMRIDDSMIPEDRVSFDLYHDHDAFESIERYIGVFTEKMGEPVLLGCAPLYYPMYGDSNEFVIDYACTQLEQVPVGSPVLQARIKRDLINNTITADISTWRPVWQDPVSHLYSIPCSRIR